MKVVRKGTYKNPCMSKAWHNRQNRLVISIGKIEVTNDDLIELKSRCRWGVPGLNRVIKARGAKSLEHLARTTSVDEFLTVDGVSEVAGNLFCELLHKLTKIDPNDWLGDTTKLVARKERVFKKKRRKKKKR